MASELLARSPNEDAARHVVTENTYILHPEGYGKAGLIRQGKIQQIVQAVLEQRLAGQVYDPLKAAQRAKQLADDVKEQVKALGYHRHKIIVQVDLGQRRGQAMRIVSRCLWDSNADTCASASYSSETLFCACQVYGIFVE